jgi:hypothetical protein
MEEDLSRFCSGFCSELTIRRASMWPPHRSGPNRPANVPVTTAVVPTVSTEVSIVRTGKHAKYRTRSQTWPQYASCPARINVARPSPIGRQNLHQASSYKSKILNH